MIFFIPAGARVPPPPPLSVGAGARAAGYAKKFSPAAGIGFLKGGTRLRTSVFLRRLFPKAKKFSLLKKVSFMHVRCEKSQNFLGKL